MNTVRRRGWAFAFRAGVGIFMALLTIVIGMARIEVEEQLLSEAFGVQCETYRARTWRLIPHAY